MGLEITIDELVRTPREGLTPGTIITRLTDDKGVRSLIKRFGRKLSTGEKLAVKYSSLSAERKILIVNDDFRNTNLFWGKIKPEHALIVPAAGVNSVRARPPQQLNPEGLALLLRYKLISTGGDKIYLVECSFFREVAARRVWVFAKERKKRDAMENLIERRSPGYAERLREGLDLIYAAP